MRERREMLTAHRIFIIPKSQTKGKRVMRRSTPSQEPAGKAEADAAKNNSTGGDSAIVRARSGRKRACGFRDTLMRG